MEIHKRIETFLTSNGSKLPSFVGASDNPDNVGFNFAYGELEATALVAKRDSGWAVFALNLPDIPLESDCERFESYRQILDDVAALTREVAEYLKALGVAEVCKD